jgi:hypothetical protein
VRVFALAVVVAQVVSRGETGFDRDFIHTYLIVAGSLAPIAAQVGKTFLQLPFHALLAAPLYLFKHGGQDRGQGGEQREEKEKKADDFPPGTVGRQSGLKWVGHQANGAGDERKQ